jgi:cardiolipin synthase
MLRIDDEPSACSCATSRGAARRNLSSRRDFGDIEIALLDGESNPQLNEPVLKLIREARESIVVQSAYLTFPFYDYLTEAYGRGVSVTLVTPRANNKPRMSGYTEWAAARAGVALRLYDGRMSHIKAMLVDDEALVVGSSNFDYLSFHTHQEVLAIVRNPEVIAQYKRDVLEPDLAQSVAPTGEYSHLWQTCWERSIRGAGRVAAPVSHWLRGRRAARRRAAAVVPAQAGSGLTGSE